MIPGAESHPPLVLSTWSFGPVANRAALASLAAGGSPLDAAVAGATACENDESIDSVGMGGLPDADGIVSLDACVMESPGRCAGVCNVRHHSNPAAIARRVMDSTIHKLLAGQAADDFADRQGFPRADLLTAAAAGEWRRWRDDPRAVDRDHYRGWIPPLNVEELRGVDRASAREPSHDTVCVLCMDPRAAAPAQPVAGACSTSGMAFKVPGRVGDSPIIGAGLYVDPSAGAAAATGSGELILTVCGSFLAVERMRAGDSPLQAALYVLGRIAQVHSLHRDHQVAMIVLDPSGSWASAALRPGFHHTISDAAGTRVEPCTHILFPA